MKVLNKKEFKLPYIDSQTYRELMRLGLHYDKQLRSYNAEELEGTNVDAILALLKTILHEPVCFDQGAEGTRSNGVGQTCLICGKGFACEGCRYFELCETKSKPSSCVCGKCLEEGKTF